MSKLKHAIIALVLASTLPLTASAPANSERVLFTYSGTNVYPETLMGVSKRQFVSALKPLFSWSKPAAFAIETERILGKSLRTNEVPKLETALGDLYDEAVKGRILPKLAELVVDETGTKGFHYDKRNVEFVIKKAVAYQSEESAFQRQLAKLTNPMEIPARAKSFNAKWISQYSWYKPGEHEKGQQKWYGQALGTRAIEIDLACGALLNTNGWDLESFDRRMVKIGNFAYETRTKVHPQVAARYLDDYAKQFVRYNVFIVEMSARTNLDKIEKLLATTVDQDGVFGPSGMKRINAPMRSLGGVTGVVHYDLDKGMFERLLNVAPDFEHVTQGPITGVERQELAKLFNGPGGRKAASKTSVFHYFVIKAIKGSEAPARSPERADPINSEFSNFISERYLGEKVAKLLLKVHNANPQYMPSPVEIRQMIEGTDVQNIFFGWESDRLKPID